jgi:Short repeat of unknown function (DUF308)
VTWILAVGRSIVTPLTLPGWFGIVPSPTIGFTYRAGPSPGSAHAGPRPRRGGPVGRGSGRPARGAYGRPVVADLRHHVDALRGGWLWFVVLGVAMIVLGCIALGSAVIASPPTAMVIGALLLVSGAAEIIGAFWCRGWSGFFFHLLSGVLSVVVGQAIPSGTPAAAGILGGHSIVPTN